MIGAVDIGGTKIAVGIVDDHGRVLSQTQSPTDPENYSGGIDLIAQMLRQTAQKAGVDLSGIGIGSTGPVDPMRGEFGDVDFLPGWRGKSPVRDLSQIFNLHVALENDGDAAALAEAGWGAGQNCSRLIYVTVGTGIGGGIIIDGQLYRGVGGAHPEVGHQVIDPAGPKCSCGFHGCWESLAAGPAMVTWLENHGPASYPHREGITAKRICELAQQGDEVALQAVEHLQQRDIRFSDRFVEPVLFQEIVILRVPDIGQVGVQNQQQITLWHDAPQEEKNHESHESHE